MKLCLLVLVLCCVSASAAHLYVGNCPILTTSTIGEAACATPLKPYAAELDDRQVMRAMANPGQEKSFLPKRDGVQFVATTQCPSGIWKKFFQSYKEYRPTKEENLKEGKAYCKYRLDSNVNLGKRLQDKVGVESVNFFVNLPTIHEANAWSGSVRGWVKDSKDRGFEFYGSRCPPLTSEMLKKREFHRQYTSWRGEKAVLTYEATDDTKVLSKLSTLLLGSAGLDASGTLGEPFEVKCTYVIHPNGRGSDAKDIVLFGTNGSFK